MYVYMYMYREDAETTMNKTLSDMKNSLDERMKEKIALEEEIDYLKETVGRIQGQLNHTQAEVQCSFSTQTNDHYVDCKPAVLYLHGLLTQYTIQASPFNFCPNSRLQGCRTELTIGQWVTGQMG